MLKRVGLIVLTGVIGLAGCKPDAAVKQAEVIDNGTKPAEIPSAPLSSAARPTVAIDPSSLGTVSGTIHFNGKAPAPVRIDTSMDPACNLGGGPEVYSEQFVVNAGKLANVFVYVKNGPATAMAMGASTPAPVVLDQKGCQYVPHVVGVMQGGFVEFHNSDPTMHNIHTMPTVVGNQTVDVSQGPRGAAQSKQFKVAEMMIPVRCNNHPWMNAFINVSPTPFFQVTGKDGTFRLSGLPAGNYTIGAVQEKLGEKTMSVTVTAKGTAVADFGFGQ